MSSKDIMVLLICTIAFIFVLLNLSIFSKWFGLTFVIILLVYVFFTLKNSTDNSIENIDYKNLSIPKSTIIFVLGLLGVILGSEILVNSAINIFSKYFGVRDAIIGIGVLAFGTSLPEVTTSVIAAIKKENSIAIGNIIGSSIFNILAIGGVTLLVSNKYDLENAIINIYDLLPFILATLILVLFYKFKFSITKLYGALFVIFYLFWITFIFLN